MKNGRGFCIFRIPVFFKLLKRPLLIIFLIIGVIADSNAQNEDIVADNFGKTIENDSQYLNDAPSILTYDWLLQFEASPDLPRAMPLNMKIEPVELTWRHVAGGVWSGCSFWFKLSKKFYVPDCRESLGPSVRQLTLQIRVNPATIVPTRLGTDASINVSTVSKTDRVTAGR